MGREKSVFKDLPQRMTARRMKSGKLLYYYQAAGKKIPLGADRAAALVEWAKLEAGTAGPKLFPEVAAKYREEALRMLADSSRVHYEIALDNLEKVFATFSLEQIHPKHVKKYIRDRSKKGAALFEKRVLSAFYTWARGDGHTSSANPCSGVRFSNAEKRALGIQHLGKRKRYVKDGELDVAYENAAEVMQDAMDLALHAGQRPGDLLASKRTDIEEGVLYEEENRLVKVIWFTQKKTEMQEGVIVEGELERVLERILTRPRPVQSIYILCDKDGQRIRYAAFNKMFRKARGEADWQFRDLRAKAATDSPDLKTAQRLLGHVNETTTVIYRRRTGSISPPLQRKKLEPSS